MTTHSQMTDALRRVLADTYSLYVKTHGYHWNVEGPRFKSLHELFEEQYTALLKSVDDVAERIRALGAYAPMGPVAITEGTTIDVPDNTVPSANTMVQNLVTAHEAWLVTAKEAIDVADQVNDAASDDLLGALINEHEKMTWMLRASLER